MDISPFKILGFILKMDKGGTLTSQSKDKQINDDYKASKT